MQNHEATGGGAHPSFLAAGMGLILWAALANAGLWAALAGNHTLSGALAVPALAMALFTLVCFLTGLALHCIRLLRQT